MTWSTTILNFASVFISSSVFFSFPATALCVWVFVLIRSASVILPVVGINAKITLMLFVTEWTPHCFKMEHVEIRVFFHFIKLCDRQFRLVMSKSANLPIFTLVYIFRISRTKFGLVLFWMVKFLDSVMTFNTVRPLLTFRCVEAHFWSVTIRNSSLVFCFCLMVK
jgi:hypothetical protein